MNRRRVLHVLNTAEPAGAAMIRVVESLAVGVDPARYTIEACFLHHWGPLAEHLQRAGVKTTFVNWHGGARDPWGAIRYATLLRSATIDIIHQHAGGRLLTGMGRRLTHARLVIHLHGRTLERTGTVPPSSKLPTRDALIANSRAVAEYSGDPHAVVVYPGVGVSSMTGRHKKHKGLVIGTACRLEPIKGLTYLLKAFAVLALESCDLRLEIAGDGSLRAALEQECLRLGVSGHVSFLGWREDLPSVMAGWDIFVLPSLDEGFGVAALEAMAAGLPVVASAVGGVCELVQHGRTGWLVPSAEADELAIRLRELLHDHQKREIMGAAGRQRAWRDFSASRMVDQIITVYDRLTAEKTCQYHKLDLSEKQKSISERHG